MTALLQREPDRQGGNYQQRLFDAFPPFPATISVGDLRDRFPSWDRRMLENALNALRALRKVERVQIGVYRLAGANVSRPVDGRGGPRKRG